MLEFHLSNITENNRIEKFHNLEIVLKSKLYGYKPILKKSISKSIDDSKKLDDCIICIDEITEEKVEKALRTMAFSLDIPYSQGEIFFYRSQEELTNKWLSFYSQLVNATYQFVIDYFDLPEIKIMSKSDLLRHKGKILYSPENGEPIKKSEWNKFVANLEKFLNRNKGESDKIVLDAKALAKILDRMLKYNKLSDVKDLSYNDIVYNGKKIDWISDSVKNMKSTFGESLTRNEQARIEVMQQSAAQRLQGTTEKMKNSVQQILIDGVKNRKSKGEISQQIFDKMVGDNRDFQRVVDTEIQNAFNNSFLLEEVYNTPDGEKTYFERIEIIDDNTCKFCQSMNGKVVVWSDTPLSSDKVKDRYTDMAIWEGKEWEGKNKVVTTGVFHPYCRGTWVRWSDGDDIVNSIIAEKSKKAERWNNAVDKATKEFKEKGIKEPNDQTEGFTERIAEIYNENNSVNKSLTYSGHKLQDRKNFNGLQISIENKKGSYRTGKDRDGHQWKTKMNYDYGYIRGTVGTDGDHVDCYLGNNENAKNVYIVHQNDPITKLYDEDKIMLGFGSLDEARRAYLSQYDRSGFLGSIDTVSFENFKNQLFNKKNKGKKLKINKN